MYVQMRQVWTPPNYKLSVHDCKLSVSETPLSSEFSTSNFHLPFHNPQFLTSNTRNSICIIIARDQSKWQ